MQTPPKTENKQTDHFKFWNFQLEMHIALYPIYNLSQPDLATRSRSSPSNELDDLAAYVPLHMS